MPNDMSNQSASSHKTEAGEYRASAQAQALLNSVSGGAYSPEVALPSDGEENLIAPHDLDGRAVQTFMLEESASTVRWDAEGHPEGIYYCQLLQPGKEPSSLKLILIK